VGLMRGLARSRIAGLALLLGIAWAGGRAAVGALAKDPRFLARPDWPRVRGPAWAGRESVAPVVDRLRRLGPINLFDPDGAGKVRRALLELPDVARVGVFEKLWPARYAVHFTLRRPAAVVTQGRREIPVTITARVLSLAPNRRTLRGLLRVAGIGGAAPAPGAVWSVPALLDALATVRQLAAHRRVAASLGLHTIDVAGSGDPLRGVVLRGRDGLAILWGRPRALVGENPVETKIAFLRIAAKKLDLIRGREFDVRFQTPALRQLDSP